MKLGSSPLSAGVGLWFLPRRNGHALLGFAGDAVRVAKGKLAFVAGGGFDIQNASREAVGDRLRHAFALAIHAFAANAQQWQRGTPRRRTYLAKADVNGRVAVGIAFDGPFEAKVQQSGMFTRKRPARVAFLRLRGKQMAGGEEWYGEAHYGRYGDGTRVVWRSTSCQLPPFFTHTINIVSGISPVALCEVSLARIVAAVP